MTYNLAEFDQRIKSMLCEKRYHHTLAVVKQARLLATLYGCDVHKAEVAAYLHDICKEMTYDEMLHWMDKFGIILDDTQRCQQKTWHGMAACGYLKFELGVDDPEILTAIRYHTTACGHMSTLDEVVYLADLTGEDRTYPDVEHMRKLAFDDRRMAMKEAMRFSLTDLVNRSMSISRDSLEAYNYYVHITQ